MNTKLRSTALGFAAAAALAVPASAMAETAPTKQDRTNASKECRAERGTSDATREAFAARYKNFGTCVSRRARDEKAESSEAKQNAAQQCKAERGLDAQAFKAKYGTNQNKSNAFGKCVSQQAKANEKQADAEDRQEIENRQNAAKACDAERGETAATREAFRQKYGTNKNKRNAFGKCVSQQAKAQEQAPATS